MKVSNCNMTETEYMKTDRTCSVSMIAMEGLLSSSLLTSNFILPTSVKIRNWKLEVGSRKLEARSDAHRSC